MDTPAATPAGYFRWFWIILACGIALRLLAAFYSQGTNYSDEHQQYMEQAYRDVHGYGMTCWEQERGIRHLCTHLPLAGLLACLEFLGIVNPLIQASLMRATVSLAVCASLVLVALGLYRRGQPVACLFLMFLFAFMLDVIYFNVRILTDNAILFPLALVLWEKKPGWAGLWLGLMFGLRMQSILLTAGFWQVTALGDWRQRKSSPSVFVVASRTAWLSLGLLLGLLVVGGWDYLEYGSWFHSSLANLHANMIEGVASQMGTDAVWYYAWELSYTLFLSSVVAIPLLWQGIKRAPGLAYIAGLYLFVHSLIPHKEFRFLWGIYPILCILMALGFERLLFARSDRRALLTWVAASFLAGNCIRFFLLPWNEKPITVTANLLQRLNTRAEVKGVAISACGQWESGNYFYLRRQSPLYYPGSDLNNLVKLPQYRAGLIDFLIVPRKVLACGPAIPFRQLEEYRGWALLEKTP